MKRRWMLPTVRPRAQSVEPDPDRLQEIEDRLHVVERLLRKYGVDTGEILAYRERATLELEELLLDEHNRDALEDEAPEESER